MSSRGFLTRRRAGYELMVRLLVLQSTVSPISVNEK